MEQIKNYFKAWNVSRIIRMVVAIGLAVGYLQSKEGIFLFASLVLGLQAIFNISCPGGSCETSVPKDKEPIVKVKEFEQEK